MHLALVTVLLLAITAFIPGIIGSWRNKLEKEFLRYSEVLIVFAHPDDETMFFLPLIGMARKLRVKFRLLCLTNGGYDGLGSVRSKEFKNVAVHLTAESFNIVNDPRLKDGPESWDPIVVRSVVEKYLSRYPVIDSIFTFDDFGVSGHPNHISVYKGVSSLQTSIPRYYLNSVNLLIKYFPPLAFFMTLFTPSQNPLIAVNHEDPFLSSSTMKLYESQNVWFRRLFSLFSQYSYINTFSRN